MTDPRRLRRLTNKEIHQIAEDEIPIALERLMGGDHDARAIALVELTTFARAIIACMATTPAPEDPAADQAEGPSLADVDWLCAEFGFHYDDNESLEILHNMITAAITPWRAPVTQPAAQPVDVANLMRLTEGVDPLAPGEPDVDHILTLAAIIRKVDGSHDLGAAALAEAILAHPGFSGCHDGPAALPAPDHVNLIGFAFGREPWATWLRQGGCLESAHCELSDLMLAVLAKWGRPAALPAQGEVEELVEFVDELASARILTATYAAQLRRTAELLKGTPVLPAQGFQIGPQEYIPHA